MQIFCNHAGNILSGYLLNSGAKTFQEVGGIPIVLVSHALAQDLVRSVEVEHEIIEDGVFGAFDFTVADGIRLQLVDLSKQPLNGFNRGAAFCPHG